MLPANIMAVPLSTVKGGPWTDAVDIYSFRVGLLLHESLFGFTLVCIHKWKLSKILSKPLCWFLSISCATLWSTSAIFLMELEIQFLNLARVIVLLHAPTWKNIIWVNKTIKIRNILGWSNTKLKSATCATTEL